MKEKREKTFTATPPRVPARMEGAVRNVGIKPKKKQKKMVIK
jgi:hypothetical protein